MLRQAAWFVLAVASQAAAQTHEMHRVSVSTAGAQADAPSSRPGISHDGRVVVFESEAGNLVPNDANDSPDVFVHDRLSGVTACASVGPDGLPAGGSQASISGDGRCVVFVSDMLKVPIPGCPACTAPQVFAFDRESGDVSLVSTNPLGMPANNECLQPFTSFEGRYVAFHSAALNLVPNSEPCDAWVVIDRQDGSILRTCYDCSSSFCTLEFFLDAFSADGSYLAHTAVETKSAGPQIFLTAYLDNPYSTGLWWGPPQVGGCSLGSYPSRLRLSFDGRWTVYRSYSVNCYPLLYLLHVDRLTGAYAVCNVNLAGEPAPVGEYDISPDGGFVAFASAAPHVVQGDSNGVPDVFVRDVAAGTTLRVSIGAHGEEPDVGGDGTAGVAAADSATFVAFQHLASTLVPDDDNQVDDIFVFDRDPWFDLGSGLAGVQDIPRLAAVGTLEPAAPGTLLLSRAAAGAPALFILALDSSPTPFKGGTLVAFPPAATLALTTDAQGEIELAFQSPPLVPASKTFLQWAVADKSAAQGVALSNALKAIAP